MAETLQARLGRSSPGANLSPKKVWKKAKQKPYTDDHHDPESPAAAWSSHYTSPSFESDGGPSQSSPPSLIDRLGPKVAPPSQRRSLLERMELEGNETVEDADPGVVDSFGSNCMPVDAVPYSKVRREEDSEINTADGRSDVYHDPSEDSELMADIRHRSFATRARLSWNGVSSPTAQSRARASPRPYESGHDSNHARYADSEREGVVSTRTSEPLVVDKVPGFNNNNSNGAAPEIPGKENHAAPATPLPFANSDPGPAASSSQARPPLPLQARIGRALRSAIFQNAKLREKNETINLEKVQSKIDELVTDIRTASFGAQMRKVKQEMDASRAGRQTEETMARAKDKLLNGFESKSGTGGYADNTWLSRRDGHSLIPSLASTSILPTPPPSESLAAENMEKAPPKAPRAMMSMYSPHLPPKSVSLKGKEKAIDPLEDHRDAPRARRNSYTSNGVRAEPIKNVPPDSVPRTTDRRARSSSYRRMSASPPRSPLASYKRNFKDELPTYHSPTFSSRTPRSPPPRRMPLRSRSRSRVRTDSAPRSFTTRLPFYSPSRSPVRRSRSRSRPRRAVSHARSFNSRRPSVSRSRSRSPPPSASYSNGYPRPHEPPRGRTFSGPRPPRSYYSRSRSPYSPILNSRHPPEKRPFVRSPSPHGPAHAPRSHSPPARRRKLTHRSRSPSFGPYDVDHAPRGRLPNATPSVRHTGRDSPELMSPFHTQHPPPGRAPDSSPARPPPPPPPAPSNPCNTIPNLWFVKVGADAPKVVEGTFVIEPEVVSTWGILSAPPAPGQPPNPKLCVTLMCLLTADVIALSDSLRASAPTPSTMAAAIAGLATHWPSDGTLILDINKEAADGGKTWLPHDIDPTTPLDVTDYIRPGRNAIRFIQLADMLQHTFILCASRREPPSDSNPTDASQDMDFDDPALQLPNDLFNFCATVTVS